MKHYDDIDDVIGFPYGEEISVTLEVIGNNQEKKQLVCNETLLVNFTEALTEALKNNKYRIVGGSGIPRFRKDDGTINEKWTLEEICRFVNFVDAIVCQFSIKAKYAFLVYVNIVGTEWNEETFDNSYLGTTMKLEEFARNYIDDNYVQSWFPEFVLDFVDWKGVWCVLEKEHKLYAVKLHEEDYLIMDMSSIWKEGEKRS